MAIHRSGLGKILWVSCYCLFYYFVCFRLRMATLREETKSGDNKQSEYRACRYPCIPTMFSIVAAQCVLSA